MPEIDFESFKKTQSELLEQYASGLITKEDVMNQLGSMMFNSLTALLDSI